MSFTAGEIYIPVSGKEAESALVQADFSEARLDNLYGRCVLDVGCGFSMLTPALIEAGVDAYGVDPKLSSNKTMTDALSMLFAGAKWQGPEAVRSARYMRNTYKQFRSFKDKHPSRFVAGSMYDLPFRDDQFDLTLSIDALSAYAAFNPDNMEQSLNELVRVTKPGGIITLFPWRSDGDLATAILNGALDMDQLGDIHDIDYLTWAATNNLPGAQKIVNRFVALKKLENSGQINEIVEFEHNPLLMGVHLFLVK